MVLCNVIEINRVNKSRNFSKYRSYTIKSDSTVFFFFYSTFLCDYSVLRIRIPLKCAIRPWILFFFFRPMDTEIIFQMSRLIGVQLDLLNWLQQLNVSSTCITITMAFPENRKSFFLIRPVFVFVTGELIILTEIHYENWRKKILLKCIKNIPTRGNKFQLYVLQQQLQIDIFEAP